MAPKTGELCPRVCRVNCSSGDEKCPFGPMKMGLYGFGPLFNAESPLRLNLGVRLCKLIREVALTCCRKPCLQFVATLAWKLR
jgi:hypothetical protein